MVAFDLKVVWENMFKDVKCTQTLAYMIAGFYRTKRWASRFEMQDIMPDRMLQACRKT